MLYCAIKLAAANMRRLLLGAFRAEVFYADGSDAGRYADMCRRIIMRSGVCRLL